MLPTGLFAVLSEIEGEEEDDDDNNKKNKKKKKRKKRNLVVVRCSFFSSVYANIPEYFQDAVAITAAGSCTPEFICLVANTKK